MAYKATIDSSTNQSIHPTILCVEDNQAYLRLRKAVLERAGYTVLAATTGVGALKVFREVAVSLVLSDHMLRGTWNYGCRTCSRVESNQAARALCSLFRDGARHNGRRRLFH